MEQLTQWFIDNNLVELMYLIRILVAALLGYALGVERMMREKEAGIRTHIILCIGAALITCISNSLGTDPARIAAQIVAGVGFIGAGMIMFRGEALHGLTTAAGIWTTAGIGMAAGNGMYIIAVGATVLVILCQIIFHGRHSNYKNFYRYLKVSFWCDQETVKLLKDSFSVKSFGRLKLTEKEGRLYADAVVRTNVDCGVDKLAAIISDNDNIIAIERLDVSMN